MTAPLTADTHEYGLVGDGTADDRPALQELVDVLGDATAEDGRPRTVRAPAGRYVIRNEPVLWRSGVSLVGAGRGATCFALSNRSYSVSRSESWTHSCALRTSRTVLDVLVTRVRAASGGTDRVRGPGRRGRVPSRPGVSGPVWADRCLHPSLWWVRGGAVRRRMG